MKTLETHLRLTCKETRACYKDSNLECHFKMAGFIFCGMTQLYVLMLICVDDSVPRHENGSPLAFAKSMWLLPTKKCVRGCVRAFVRTCVRVRARHLLCLLLSWKLSLSSVQPYLLWLRGGNFTLSHTHSKYVFSLEWGSALTQC